MPPHRDGAGDILIFGCGRWFCRDDQVGLLVAQALEQRALRRVRVITSENPGADLPSCLAGEQLLVVVDAAAADDRHPPGTWQRIDARSERNRILPGGLPAIDGFGAVHDRAGRRSAADFRPRGRAVEAPSPSAESMPPMGHVGRSAMHRANTHMIGVGVALDLAANLNVLPETVWVYAIAIDSAERGEDVASAVERAALEVAETITVDIRRWRTSGGPQHA